MAHREPEFDFVVIGSGFGGSVAALRLAQKGYSVAILEQGRRISPAMMAEANTDPRKLMWAPRLGLKGFFTQTIYRHMSVMSGVGVGGGSLVYAGVLLEPKDAFYQDRAWSGLGVDWKKELAPHFATASRMLGTCTNPYFGKMDAYLKAAAEATGVGDTFGQVPQGIFFENPGKTVPDPFFDGEGPPRTGCTQCGCCVAGCSIGAKNSLDKNYLYLAEGLGAQVIAERRAVGITPLDDGGYEVRCVNPLDRSERIAPVRGRKVVLAAGVQGSVELLFRCRDEDKTMPLLSPRLGHLVRTNNEAIVAILSKDEEADLSSGTTISTDYHPDPQTHITQNRFPPSYGFMRALMGPLVDDARPWRRALRTLSRLVSQPLRSTASVRSRRWHKRVSVLTVMQTGDGHLSLEWGRSAFSLFQKGLQTRLVSGERPLAYLPQANAAARAFAEASDGVPLNVLPESLLNQSVTAHILGGCAIGSSAEQGVISPEHEVFGYPGVYVTDASAIPANVGVNPSLTITALAERCMSLIPAKPGG